MALGQTINCFLRRQALVEASETAVGCWAFPALVGADGAEVFACRQLLQDGAGIQVNFDHCLMWDGETHRDLLSFFYRVIFLKCVMFFSLLLRLFFKQLVSDRLW